MKKTDVLLGFLAGAAAGALVGMLYAPAKGSKTRKKLYRKGEEAIGDLRDKTYILAAYANEVNNEIDRLADKVEASIAEAAVEATERVEEYLRKKGKAL